MDLCEIRNGEIIPLYYYTTSRLDEPRKLNWWSLSSPITLVSGLFSEIRAREIDNNKIAKESRIKID
jgi:hypothetical protein